MQPTASLQVAKESLSLRERTTIVLRNAILTMRFKPGERLVERQLCIETGVSRTCVRESMRQLEAEGLVRRTHSKSLIVSSITAEEAAEIYEVRRVLETGLLEKLVRGADRGIAADIGAKIDAAEACLDRPADYVAAIGEVIDALWIGYDNETAKALLGSIFDRISYIRIILSLSTSAQQKGETIGILRGVVDAIGRRDVAAAQQRYAHYLSRAEATVIDIIEAAQAPGSVAAARGRLPVPGATAAFVAGKR